MLFRRTKCTVRGRAKPAEGEDKMVSDCTGAEAAAGAVAGAGRLNWQQGAWASMLELSQECIIFSQHAWRSAADEGIRQATAGMAVHSTAIASINTTPCLRTFIRGNPELLFKHAVGPLEEQ